GGSGVVEINKRLRPDRALQLAFGCDNGCAEQSVVQETLNACTEQNVSELEAAVKQVYRSHSRGYQHNYQHQWQLLDVDLSGRTCGKQAHQAQKGYFNQGRNRRGRQVGRVLVSRYQEIVIQRLYPGQTQLTGVLPELVEAAADILGLDEAKRRRTIIRFDAGGGSVAVINDLLQAGYQLHGKDFSGPRIKKLTQAIKEWFPDPTDPNRQLAWLPQETQLYQQPLYRLAVRARRSKKRWGVGLILSSLKPETVLDLTGQPATTDPHQQGLAYLSFYDQRAGSIEISFKQDNQGLAATKRNKKKFAAQQMLLLLETLAHNTIVWLRHKLAEVCPALAKFGLKRWVRDVFHIPGLLCFDQACHLFQIVLQQSDPIARKLAPPLASLARSKIYIILGEI
ncbi:MAG TPA: hypothetical protein VJN01_06170, partial [Xanthomonadales bacterium]|nr:hypothetical protein [Xanthomonadales bacterium]